MHWAMLGAATVGVLVGLRLLAPALMAASAGAAALNVVVGALSGWSLSFILLSTAGLIAALQLGYLVGAFLANSRGNETRPDM